MSFQYLQKGMGDEVDFSLADKHKSFLLGNSIALGVAIQACPKYPKQQVCNQYLQKYVDEIGFSMQINVKAFFKLILSF